MRRLVLLFLLLLVAGAAVAETGYTPPTSTSCWLSWMGQRKVATFDLTARPWGPSGGVPPASIGQFDNNAYKQRYGRGAGGYKFCEHPNGYANERGYAIGEALRSLCLAGQLPGRDCVPTFEEIEDAKFAADTVRIVRAAEAIAGAGSAVLRLDPNRPREIRCKPCPRGTARVRTQLLPPDGIEISCACERTPSSLSDEIQPEPETPRTRGQKGWETPAARALVDLAEGRPIRAEAPNDWGRLAPSLTLETMQKATPNQENLMLAAAALTGLPSGQGREWSRLLCERQLTRGFSDKETGATYTEYHLGASLGALVAARRDGWNLEETCFRNIVRRAYGWTWLFSTLSDREMVSVSPGVRKYGPYHEGVSASAALILGLPEPVGQSWRTKVDGRELRRLSYSVFANHRLEPADLFSAEELAAARLWVREGRMSRPMIDLLDGLTVWHDVTVIGDERGQAFATIGEVDGQNPIAAVAVGRGWFEELRAPVPAGMISWESEAPVKVQGRYPRVSAHLVGETQVDESTGKRVPIDTKIELAVKPAPIVFEMQFSRRGSRITFAGETKETPPTVPQWATATETPRPPPEPNQPAEDLSVGDLLTRARAAWENNRPRQAIAWLRRALELAEASIGGGS